MSISPGQRWRTRDGQTVTVVEVRDTGLPYYDTQWRKLGAAFLVICVTDDGEKFCVFNDGKHVSAPRLDLIEMIQARAA